MVYFRFHFKMAPDNYSIKPELIQKVYDRSKVLVGINLAEDFSQDVMQRSIEYLNKYNDKSVEKVVQESFIFELIHRYSKRINAPSIGEIKDYYDYLLRNFDKGQNIQDLLIITSNRMNTLELLISRDLLAGLTTKDSAKKHNVSEACILSHLSQLRYNIFNVYLPEVKNESE